MLGLDALIAPLIGRHVEERRSGLVAGWAYPIERERDRLPAGQRAHLLLPDVVRPAAAVDALAAAQHQQREKRAVGLVGVIPMVSPRAHADHRPPLDRKSVVEGKRGDL